MDADLNDVLDCEEGRYPYPDACVKLVMGIERNPRAAIPRMAAMVIVSTKDELAEITFETYSPDYARHTVSSLPDVRRQVQQLQGLDAQRQEEARVLRWGGIVAHGRAIPLPEQSDATKMPPNCFTFQPDNKVKAIRVGEIRDFSQGGPGPLEPRLVSTDR